LSAHVLAEGDVVFGRKGAVDRHLFVTKDQEGWLQGSDCIRLRLFGSELLARFFSYALLMPSHKRWMIGQAENKATMASLNHDVVNRIAVPLPPPRTQERIVEALSAFDDLIENNCRRMALLEDAARQLFREWFVRLRFPGNDHQSEQRRPAGPADLRGPSARQPGMGLGVRLEPGDLRPRRDTGPGIRARCGAEAGPAPSAA
jgi:type I restriction enzyme S subunit